MSWRRRGKRRSREREIVLHSGEETKYSLQCATLEFTQFRFVKPKIKARVAKFWSSKTVPHCSCFFYFFGLCLTSELCPPGTVTDWPDSKRGWLWVRDRGLNHWPPPHDSSSGEDSVYCLSAIPGVSFKSNSFTIRRPSPMLVWKMPTPGHGDSDSSIISTSTRLSYTSITRPGTDLTPNFGWSW